MVENEVKVLANIGYSYRHEGGVLEVVANVEIKVDPITLVDDERVQFYVMEIITLALESTAARARAELEVEREVQLARKGSE